MQREQFQLVRCNSPAKMPKTHLSWGSNSCSHIGQGTSTDVSPCKQSRPLLQKGCKMTHLCLGIPCVHGTKAKLKKWTEIQLQWHGQGFDHPCSPEKRSPPVDQENGEIRRKSLMNEMKEQQTDISRKHESFTVLSPYQPNMLLLLQMKSRQCGSLGCSVLGDQALQSSNARWISFARPWSGVNLALAWQPGCLWLFVIFVSRRWTIWTPRRAVSRFPVFLPMQWHWTKFFADRIDSFLLRWSRSVALIVLSIQRYT